MNIFFELLSVVRETEQNSEKIFVLSPKIMLNQENTVKPPIFECAYMKLSFLCKNFN